MKREQIARHEELRALHEIVEGTTNPETKAQASEALQELIGEVRADTRKRRTPAESVVLIRTLAIVIGAGALLLTIGLAFAGQLHPSVPVIVALVDAVLYGAWKRFLKHLIEGE